MFLTLLFLFTFLFSGIPRAQAYIDPGTGGYLITSILAMVGGFFAIASGLAMAIFRNTIGKWTHYLWKKHRLLFIMSVLAILSGTGFWAYRAFYEPAIKKFDSSLSGAHILDVAKVSPGYNLYEGKLIDAEGTVVKEWSSISLGAIDTNGDYYAQKSFEAPVWGRYTWDDKVIWEKNFPIHHEILLTPRNTLITFTKEVHDYNGRKVEFDVIVEFDKNGNELQRFSFWEHLKEFQQFHKKLELDMPPTFLIPEDHRKDKSIWGGNYDYYHLNSLSLIPENALQKTHPAFRPGNWLIAFRHGSMVFVLDQDTKQILWRAIYDQVKDSLEGPHAPTMLPDGNILLFDNGRYRKWSRLLEIEPVSLKVAWEYRADNFYTLSQGYVQKLSNGNMLVTEAEEGHAFEITPQKEIVWDFYHPEKQDEKNSTDKKKWGLRQEIYRMTRYPKEMIDPLLPQKETGR